MELREAVSDEANEFLRTHTRRYLLTLTKDGWPSGIPMGGYYNNRTLYFSTYGKSQKVRNIERDPRAACVIVADEVIDSPPGDLTGALRSDQTRRWGLAVRGRAEIMPPGSQLPDNEARSEARAGQGAGDVPEPPQLNAQRLKEGKRVILRLVPEEVAWAGPHGRD